MDFKAELRLGETTDSRTTGFTAQCYELYTLPALGSLVKTVNRDIEIYGIVYNAVTTGFEPGRRAIARGKDETSEDAIYQSNPQLLKLLRSEFSVLITGYKQNQVMYAYLPPQPARIHSFVYQCSKEEIKEFSCSLAFLSILLSSRVDISIEELVAASLRQMSAAHENRRDFLVSAGKELSALLSGQYLKLKIILEKLKL